jgi:hypothetical protein
LIREREKQEGVGIIVPIPSCSISTTEPFLGTDTINAVQSNEEPASWRVDMRHPVGNVLVTQDMPGKRPRPHIAALTRKDRPQV